MLNLDMGWRCGDKSFHDFHRDFATQEAINSRHLRGCVFRGGVHCELFVGENPTKYGWYFKYGFTREVPCRCFVEDEVVREVGCDHLIHVDLRGMNDLHNIELHNCIFLE